jgi:hypothetical protein
MTLDFGVCLGLKRKQEKNSEEPHGFHTQAEVPRSWRTRKNQVLTIPPPIWLLREWTTQDTLEAFQLRVTNRKSKVELKVPESLCRFSLHDGVQQSMHLHLQ